MDSASSLQVQRCAFSETRSQLGPSCSFTARPTRHGRIFSHRFSARRKSLPSDLIRGWGGGRQPGETLDHFGHKSQIRMGPCLRRNDEVEDGTSVEFSHPTPAS